METNNVTEKEILRYLKDIKKILVCRRSDAKKMLAELKESIYLYIDEHPEASINDIKEHFGEPAEISKGFMAEFDESYKKKCKFEKIAIIVVVAILAAILVFIGTLTTIIAINNHKATGAAYETGIYYDEIIEYEENGNETLD